MRNILFAILTIGMSGLGHAQSYPKDYFRSPLNIPLYLSGNFGEIRSNHFHTGLDIKTEAREGLPVYAAAAGFISRIKVSAVGYGLVLYIEHPNGYTTAYAHLKSFSPSIAEYIKTQQYLKKSFEIDVALKPNELTVKKGEVIGLSGNSGSSGGPHLHFEIRETKSEKAINPLFFGFDIADHVKPNIAGIRVFALNDYSNVNGGKYAVFNTQGNNGQYSLKSGQSIRINGEIGFALHTTDMLDGNANRCGVYSIEMYLNDSLVHRQEMQKLDFSLNRYMNAHCDFRQFRRSKSSIHKCFIEPNNKLDIYTYSPLRGRLKFEKEKSHNLKFVVKDAYGNQSTINVPVQGTSKVLYTGRPLSADEKLLAWNKEFKMADDGYAIEFPAGNLYRDEIVKVAARPAPPSFYSKLLEFGDDEIPVHGNYKVKLSAADVPAELLGKAFVAQVSDNGKVSRFAGKKTDGSYMVGESKVFGKFAIAADTVLPHIKPLNISEGKEFFPGQQLLFSASDALSGIGSYTLTIDGNWALVAYDAKYSRFAHEIDPRKILPGKHRLNFSVTDNVGNTRTYECSFVVR